MRGESGPLTSMGTFIRTQFSFQGFLNELKPPFCAPIEYQKGASYIYVSPPPILTLTCTLLSLNPDDLCYSQPKFCLSENHQGFQVSSETCMWFIRVWHSTHSQSCFCRDASRSSAGWGKNWKSHQKKQESRPVVGSRSSGAFASQLWQGRCSNPELGRSQLGPWLIEILIKKRPLPSILRATYLEQINILTSVIKCATPLGGGWSGARGRGKHLMQWNMHLKA